MTKEQRIQNTIELLRPLDREGMGEVAAFIATELGAMKMADEFRASIESGNTVGRFDNKIAAYYDGLPHSNS